VHRSAGRSLDIRLKLFADVCARYSDVQLVYWHHQLDPSRPKSGPTQTLRGFIRSARRRGQL